MKDPVVFLDTDMNQKQRRGFKPNTGASHLKKNAHRKFVLKKIVLHVYNVINCKII